MKNNQKMFEKHVQSLSKQELRELVHRFAPNSYKEIVVAKLASTSKKGELFLQIKSDMERAFERDVYFDYSQFASELENAANTLRGIWEVMPNEVCELFISIIQRVNELFDDGALYDHYSDDSYEGEAIGRLMAEYVLEISGREKEEAFVKICKTLVAQDYGVFGTFIPALLTRMTRVDALALKQPLIDQQLLTTLIHYHARDIFEAFSDVLSDEERKSLLETLAPQDDHFACKLAAYYEERNDTKSALGVLRKALRNQESEGMYVGAETQEIFQQAILLEEKQGCVQEATLLLREYVTRCPQADTLLFVMEHASDALRSEMEQQVEQANPDEYVVYLEKTDQLAAIPDIFLKYASQFSPSAQFEVYERYLDIFPQQLHHIAHIVLQEALIPAGEYHYSYVARLLLSLKQVTPDNEFLTRVQEIKETYKRRRNLLKILHEHGL